MNPEPLYSSASLNRAYQLRYGWTGWASGTPFSTALIANVLPGISPEWESDGLRLLESRLTPQQIQLTLSATPQIDPVTLAARVKGRIQHHCRRQGTAVKFSRKLALRSLGDPTRAEVEAYVRNQVVNEDLADERFRKQLAEFTTVDSEVDLSEPTETNSGRYWYNLHLVLVVRQRYRISEPGTLARIRDTVSRVCGRKCYRASTIAVLADHLHIALRGALEQSPEEIALSFLNNLAYALGQQPWWESGYYTGTFGEYSMAAVREYGLMKTKLSHARTADRASLSLTRRVGNFTTSRIAAELLHLPDKPAGVVAEMEWPTATPLSRRTSSPAGQAGRGRRQGGMAGRHAS